jgi:hypothetical protein
MVHGLLSTPVDETKVRVRLPAAAAGSDKASVPVRSANGRTMRFMAVAPFLDAFRSLSLVYVVRFNPAI